MIIFCIILSRGGALRLKRIRIYLDTSVISHLSAKEVPDKMNDTHILWEQLRGNIFTAVISNITLEEIGKCPEPKRELLYKYLSEINFEQVSENEESIVLTSEYLNYGVLKNKSKDDLRHIALATVLNIDYIVSWNFKHFVNVNTINKVAAINKLLNYKEISILPPSMIIEGDE